MDLHDESDDERAFVVRVDFAAQPEQNRTCRPTQPRPARVSESLDSLSYGVKATLPSQLGK